MKDLQKFGAFSAFYLAFVYIAGIALFLFVLDYPNISEPLQKMELLVTHQNLLYITNIMMYVLFGFGLIIFMSALCKQYKKKSMHLLPIATIVGIIWAGLLIASGMVANAGISQALQLYKTDPSQATLFWLQIETVANGLGGANGEILGGVMTLLIGIAGLRNGFFSRGLQYLGILVGIVGIASIIPGLHDLAGLFALAQIIWFIWTGFTLLQEKSEV